jgi:hypothetical protein
MCAEPVEFLFDLSDKLAAACRSDDRAQVEAFCGRAMGILESGEFKASTSRLPHRYEHLRRWVPRVCWCARQAKHFSSAVQDPATWQSSLEDPSRWRELQEMAEPAQDLAPWAVDMIRWLLGDPPLGNFPVRLGVPVAIVRQQKGEILRLDCETSVPQSGHCFPHPARLLKNFPDVAFLDSFAAAAAAARCGVGAEVPLPGVRWRLSRGNGRPVGDLSGPSASGAFALALSLLWRGQGPDEGTLVMAECRQDGSLKPVAGVRAKSQAALGLEKAQAINTIIAADENSRAEVSSLVGDQVDVQVAPSLACLVQIRSSLVREIEVYLNRLGETLDKESGLMHGRRVTQMWLDVQVQRSGSDRGGLPEVVPADDARNQPTLPWSKVLLEMKQGGRKHVALIGPPGSGKTYIARWTAISLARDYLSTIRARPITDAALTFPFYIPPAKLAVCRATNLSDAVIEVSAPRFRLSRRLVEWMRHRIEKGHALVVLDGIDECAASPNTKELLKDIEETPSGIVLTCRQADWEKTKRELPNSIYVCGLQYFTQRERDQFIEKWFQSTKLSLIERFRKAVLDDPGLGRLTASPLLLAVACELSQGEFLLPPHSTITELYDALLLGILSRCESSAFNREDQLDLLLRLQTASPNWFEGRTSENRVSRKELIDAGITKTEIKLLLAAGILVPRGPHKAEYAFWHLTFLEFLAGAAWADRVQKEGWPAHRDWAYRKSWLSSYREAFRFMAGKLSDPYPLITILTEAWLESNDDVSSASFQKSRLELALSCVADLEFGRDEKRELILERLARLPFSGLVSYIASTRTRHLNQGEMLSRLKSWIRFSASIYPEHCLLAGDLLRQHDFLDAAGEVYQEIIRAVENAATSGQQVLPRILTAYGVSEYQRAGKEGYVRAEGLLQRALDLLRHDGARGLQLAETLLELGKVRVSLGSYRSAEALLSEAQGIFEADDLAGRPCAGQAAFFRGLAAYWRGLRGIGRWGDPVLELLNGVSGDLFVIASSHFEKALEICEQGFGERSLPALKILHYLQEIPYGLGRYPGSLPWLRRLVSGDETNPYHAYACIIALRATAEEVGQAGDSEKARTLLHEAEALAIRYSGIDSEPVLSVRADLAALNTGSRARARPTYCSIAELPPLDSNAQWIGQWRKVCRESAWLKGAHTNPWLADGTIAEVIFIHPQNRQVGLWNENEGLRTSGRFSTWPLGPDGFNMVFDSRNRDLLLWRNTRESVYAAPVHGGDWRPLGREGVFDVQACGAPAGFNPITGRLFNFGGYGFFTYKNWWLEFDRAEQRWVEVSPNRPGVSPFPRSGQMVPGSPDTVLLFSGEGGETGLQIEATARGGLPLRQLRGEWTWLRDLWSIDLRTRRWANLLPANHASIRQEGPFGFNRKSGLCLIWNGVVRSTGADISDLVQKETLRLCRRTRKV